MYPEPLAGVEATHRVTGVDMPDTAIQASVAGMWTARGRLSGLQPLK